MTAPLLYKRIQITIKSEGIPAPDMARLLGAIRDAFPELNAKTTLTLAMDFQDKAGAT